jgi:RsiW-degrading membrane proteinase PrsW (M82 family)
MTLTESPGKRWQTILALVLSALGIVYFVIQAFGISVIWLISLFDTQTDLAVNIPNSLLVWASLLSALLLVPILWLSINRLRGKPAPAWLDGRQPWARKGLLATLLIWPVAIGLGWLIAGQPGLAVYILGPFNILVAGIPVIWVYFLAQGKLVPGGIERKWRVFGFSLTATPVLIVVTELIALAAVGLVVFVLVLLLTSINPALEQTLTDIMDQLSSGQGMEIDLQFLESYLKQPVVIFGLLAVMSGIIPLIEEILKPIALWALAGKGLTDREGFVAGLLCGAGFALLENLLYFMNVTTAEDWLFMVIGRAGTGVLHMFGSALMGWGLARTWREGKGAFLALMTVLAVGFHGLWNALAILGGLGPELAYGTTSTLGQRILFYLPLIGLLILQIMALLLINRHFRKEKAASESPSLAPSDELEIPNSSSQINVEEEL